ncbi:MAG TPA: hypothetical protein VF458_16065 [Ktedonobacteraceae bacterium]
MIRCSHCGKLAPTGAVSCQHCGMPLVSGGNGIVGGGESAQQEQLPAWLESLRAHERPVPSGQENRQPFSLDELVDEDSMPSWMRQDRRKVPENGNSDSFPALPAVPSNSDAQGRNGPASGFQAGSLIDERSLPSWMRESQASEQAGAVQNVSAHSLVDQQNLPPWIKDLNQSAQAPGAPANPYSLPAQTQAPPRGLPGQAPVTSPSVPSAPNVPQTPPASDAPLAQGFSAHDLLDMKSMPSWMSGSQGPGQGPGAPPTRPVPTGQGFSAGELIDQRSVPQWMKDLQGQEQSDPQSAMGVPVNGSGQMWGTQGQQGTVSDEGMPAGSLLDKNSMPSWLKEIQPGGSQVQTPQSAQQGFSAGSLMDAGAMPPWLKDMQPDASQAQTPPFAAQNAEQSFSANSLLDAGAMPSWMREGAQGTQGVQGLQGGMPLPQPTAQNAGEGFSANSLLDAGAMPSWMREGAQGPQGAGQGMAAGSLIDMNAMPAWMRNSDPGQSAAGGRPGQVPARPVPSRPRNEHAAQQEQSEVAANVFASMLGVAASAPALPGQEPMLGVTPGQPMSPVPSYQQSQPGMGGWQQPGMNQYNQGAAPAWQIADAQPPDRPSPAPTYPPVGQGSARYAQSAGYQQGAEQPAWSYSAADRTALGVTSGAGPGQAGPPNDPYAGHAQPVETKKKGFFDSIRDFFSK